MKKSKAPVVTVNGIAWTYRWYTGPRILGYRRADGEKVDGKWDEVHSHLQKGEKLGAEIVEELIRRKENERINGAIELLLTAPPKEVGRSAGAKPRRGPARAEAGEHSRPLPPPPGPLPLPEDAICT